eukprot:TRINITY_DN5137_c0_g1_i1.p1 TRINITY_DN5137_c0_g1~~TRINITY_DN5137_c0_g1_i1.p1  ORF type:complete len:427 (-),score=107.78 TRINITY_DN5137_c0_g1_i1:115-1395(-)
MKTLSKKDLKEIKRELPEYKFIKKLVSGKNSDIFNVVEKSSRIRFIAKIVGKETLPALRELEVLTMLQNKTEKNIVRLYECYEINEFYVFILEEATNGDLMDYLSTNSDFIGDEEKKHIFKEIILLTQECHRNRVAHLDIKPENIFLNERYEMVLGDFGSSYYWDKEASENQYVEGISGTVFYSAPEMNKSEPYDPFKADIFSLGVLLYVIFTGTWPYPGNTYEQVEKNAEKKHVQLHPQFVKTLPFHLVHLIQWMISTNSPDKRPSLTQILQHPFMQEETDDWCHLRDSSDNNSSLNNSNENDFDNNDTEVHHNSSNSDCDESSDDSESFEVDYSNHYSSDFEDSSDNDSNDSDLDVFSSVILDKIRTRKFNSNKKKSNSCIHSNDSFGEDSDDDNDINILVSKLKGSRVSPRRQFSFNSLNISI